MFSGTPPSRPKWVLPCSFANIWHRSGMLLVGALLERLLTECFSRSSLMLGTAVLSSSHAVAAVSCSCRTTIAPLIGTRGSASLRAAASCGIGASSAYWSLLAHWVGDVPCASP